MRSFRQHMESSKEKLAQVANLALKDKKKAEMERDRSKNSAAANRYRGDEKAAKSDDDRAAKASERAKRRERLGKTVTRRMLTKDD